MKKALSVHEICVPSVHRCRHPRAVRRPHAAKRTRADQQWHLRSRARLLVSCHAAGTCHVLYHGRCQRRSHWKDSVGDGTCPCWHRAKLARQASVRALHHGLPSSSLYERFTVVVSNYALHALCMGPSGYAFERRSEAATFEIWSVFHRNPRMSRGISHWLRDSFARWP